MTTLTADEIRAELAQCYSSEAHHKWNILFRHHVTTDGGIRVAETCGAYWLLDAVASHHANVRRRGGLKLMEFQKWVLKIIPASDKGCRRAVLRCFDGDTDKAIVTQRIPFTDFPLDEGVTLYVEPCGVNADETAYNRWCILLPRER